VVRTTHPAQEIRSGCDDDCGQSAHEPRPLPLTRCPYQRELEGQRSGPLAIEFTVSNEARRTLTTFAKGQFDPRQALPKPSCWREVYERPGVRVIAEVPLIRAGLLRAASRAGMRAVGGTEHPDVTLHSADLPRNESPVDVCADLGRVTVTLQGRTNPELWPVLQALVAQLLGDEERPNQS
jgi:hypothetical protein